MEPSTSPRTSAGTVKSPEPPASAFFPGTAHPVQPFFAPAALVQRDTAEDIAAEARTATADESSFLADAGEIESTFPSGITDPDGGYMSFRGGRRIMDRLSALDTTREAQHIMDSFDRVEEGEGGARYLDRNLALAIAFRESGSLALSSGDTPVNSFVSGGLDHLNRERARLVRGGFIPRDVSRGWTEGVSDWTEGTEASTIRWSHPVMLPQRDLLIAYGGVVAGRRRRFEQAAESRGLSIEGLSLRARRVWTAIFFGGPGGLRYDSFMRGLRAHDGAQGWIGSHYGALTLMSFIAERGHSLNDILNIETLEPQLYSLGRTRSAFIVTAEAEVLDQVLPQFANATETGD